MSDHEQKSELSRAPKLGTLVIFRSMVWAGVMVATSASLRGTRVDSNVPEWLKAG